MRWILLALALWGCGVSSDVSRAVGARCDRKEDCDERCLVESGGAFPGGFCTLSCLGDRDCPDQATCADVEGGACLRPCGDDGDCEFLGAGWRCVERDAIPSGQVKVCLGD